MAISGSAFAQGLISGLGSAGQKYFEDQRRERMDTRKMAQAFDLFTKQTDYSVAAQTEKEKGVAMYKAGMEDINTMNTQRTEWERVSKMDVGNIVYENALEASKTFAPKDRPAFIRDYMKRKNGISKTVALNDRGLTLPDYSRYAGKEEYKDAIPQAYLAGDPTMPDAESMYKFDPEAGFMKEAQVQAEKFDVYDKKKRDAVSVIKDAGLIDFQAEPSDAVAEYLWLKRPSGEDATLSGADIISNDKLRTASLIASGEIVKIGGQLKFKRELDDAEKQLLGIPPETNGMQPMPAEPPMDPSAPEQPVQGTEYVIPEKQAYLDEQEEKKETAKMDKAIKGISKDLGTGKGTPLTTHTELSEAVATLDAMDDDALDYLFQVGFSNETVRDVKAKFGSEAAQQAKDLIAKMSGSVNSIRHELFGSALTETEAAKFREQFSDVGAFNNKENLKNQLGNLISKAEMGAVEKTSGYTPEQRAAFIERNPQYKALMSQVAYGDSKETVSDLGSKQVVKDESGKDVSSTLPEQFWSASPEMQQKFLAQYNLTIGG